MATSKDPYAVLGVPKSADAATLKKAFRDLAKQHHPDKNKGNKTAEAKFKEINTAYDLLSDPTKRARFDRGELDAAGNERGYSGGGQRSGAGGASGFSGFDFNQGGAGRTSSAGGSFGFDAEDLFSELFGRARGKSQQSAGGQQQRTRGFEQAIPGEDVRYELAITLAEAVRGGKRRITLATGKTIDVTIPPGTADGDTLRLKGQGSASRAGGPAGAALVELKIEPHGHFTFKAPNLYVDVPISLQEAVLGGEIKVPTLDGPVTVKVPKGSNSGTQLRLKGKGALARTEKEQPGDQYLTLKVMLPEKPDAELTKLVEAWGETHKYNPRKFS